MAEGSKLYKKSQLLGQLRDSNSDLSLAIANQYSDSSILDCKKQRIQKLLEEEVLLENEPTIISRCPGRISLSKHADYINNDLLYVLDDRDIYLAAQKNDEEKLILINQNPEFENIELDIDKLDQVDKNQWYFYPMKLYSILTEKNQGMTLIYNSDLPEAAGLSSSHALMVSTAIALINLTAQKQWIEALKDRIKHKSKIQELILILQEVEHSRGFKSGLGDQSAQLFGKKEQFCFIKLEPLSIEYQAIPEDLGLITATSPEKADKSLPEFQAANENIQAYKSINNFAKEHNCNHLGDLIYQYSEAEIFKLLEEIQDHKLRGLALYGLAEAARVMQLKQNLSSHKLGEHLNLSHRAENNFEHKDGKWQAMTETGKQNYVFDQSKALSEHSGIYRASTLINDQLQGFSNSLDGVYGSSISGAGLGGSNSIICKKTLQDQIKTSLSKGFHLGQKVDIHTSSSSNAADLLL